MIIEGDGTFEKRLDEGRCPKCDCATLKKCGFGRLKCSTCTLVVDNRSTVFGPPEKPDEDAESTDAYDQRYAQCDNL